MTLSLEEAIEDADAILLLVRHKDFIKIKPDELLKFSTARVVIDSVNAWNAIEWQNSGFRVFRLGSSKPIK